MSSSPPRVGCLIQPPIPCSPCFRILTWQSSSYWDSGTPRAPLVLPSWTQLLATAPLTETPLPGQLPEAPRGQWQDVLLAQELSWSHLPCDIVWPRTTLVSVLGFKLFIKINLEISNDEYFSCFLLRVNKLRYAR